MIAKQLGPWIYPEFQPVPLMRRMFADRYTSIDDDDIFFSKSPPHTHTPSRTARIRSGKASVKLPASKPSIKGEPIIVLTSDDEDKLGLSSVSRLKSNCVLTVETHLLLR